MTTDVIDNLNVLNEEMIDITVDVNLVIIRIEIEKAIDKLKAKKSAGIDRLISEYFKAGKQTLIYFLYSLFNLIFENGVFPKQWAIGIIVPLHKSGDTRNPDNYRGITLTSILGKLYTSILNSRLVKWADTYMNISESQAGFSNGLFDFR